MRFSQEKKKQSFIFITVKVLILTLCITSLAFAGVSEATLTSSKNESNLLLQQITELKTDNDNLKSENVNLIASITKNEDLYKEKLKNAKIAYLTFDDGPSSNTVAILEILKQYDIKATFFVNGKPNLKSLYKQIFNDGHVLANHTYSHDYRSIYSSPGNFKKDVEKLDIFITEVTGKAPAHILRYPGGSNNTISHNYGGLDIMNSVIKEMNNADYLYFDWNVDSTDASTFRQSKENIVQAVLSESSRYKQANILMHDTDPKTTTVQALPEIIEGLKSQGFIFGTLSETTYAPQFNVVK